MDKGSLAWLVIKCHLDCFIIKIRDLTAAMLALL